MSNIIKELENKIHNNHQITLDEALRLYNTDEPTELFAAANRIRQEYTGNRIDLCTIMNAKGGACSEDCKFCAQSAHYGTESPVYPLIPVENALTLAQENESQGVHRFSLVTSGKGVSQQDLDALIEIYQKLKKETQLKLCASLGIISYQQAVRLKEAGVTMYHHNVETSRAFFPNICTSHTYEERVETIKNVMEAGIEVCCGGIIGMGERLADRINMALEIKEMGIKSIPINILNPIKGTPFENMKATEPMELLKIFAVYRFILPDGFIRYAGGRSALGHLQRLGFNSGVNAALVGNYLTTIGNNIAEDIQMIFEEGLTF